MKYNTDGILLLRNAIVEDAAKEYISLKREIERLKKQPASEKRRITMEYKEYKLSKLKEWFLSEEFDGLALSHDGSFYIRKLDALSRSKQIHHPIIERHKYDKCKDLS